MYAIAAGAGAGFAVVRNAAAAAELPPQVMEYEHGHNRHPDIWVEQMDEVPEQSNLKLRLLER